MNPGIPKCSETREDCSLLSTFLGRAINKEDTTLLISLGNGLQQTRLMLELEGYRAFGRLESVVRS